MALNKTILKKIAEQTEGDPRLRDFLTDIFQFESMPKGWYEKKYSEFLEKVCMEEE